MFRLSVSPVLLRALAFAVVASVMAIRAVIPAGYMLDVAKDGGIIVRICGGVAEHFMVFDPETGEHRELAPGKTHNAPDKKAPAGGVCPFALSAISNMAPPFAAVSPPSSLPLIENAPAIATRTVKRHANSFLPARGPPALF